MIDINIKDIDLKFNTDSEVFSPKGIDRGTLAMLSIIDFNKEDKILDLGCGYGVVGVLFSKLIGENRITMVDINEKAIELSKENAELNNVGGVNVHKSDGFKGIEESGFTLILSNPPYHTDFAVPKEFIEKGFNRLMLGGKMYMVTKRKDWYKNKFISIFGGVIVNEIDGYYIFMAEKKSYSYAKKKK